MSIKNQVTFIFIFYFASFNTIHSQTNYRLSGFISDKQSGEAIINANVLIDEGGKNIISNNYGFFTTKLSTGKHKIYVRYAGKSQNFEFDIIKDTSVLLLFDPVIEMEGLIVTASKKNIIDKNNPGLNSIPIKNIQSIPQLMGERDVIKVFQLMPGIQSGSEGNTGLVVRGGSIDQNLVLLDGIEIFNPNHALGFFSVFNDDAINSAGIYKGYIPAKFNGRLSSVIDIQMKEGNNQKFSVNGSVGILSSKLMMEGPIIKGKSSFLVTSRISYLNLFITPIMKHFTTFDNASYNFYDITAKANYSLNNSDKLFFSFYKGYDKGNSGNENKFQDNTKITDDDFKIVNSELTNTDWGNTMTVLRWNHIFGGKTFANFTLANSQYSFNSSSNNIQKFVSKNIVDSTEQSNFFSSSDIIRYDASYNISFQIGTSNSITTGTKFSNLSLSPVNKSYSGTYLSKSVAISQNLKNNEASFYADDKIQINNKFEITPGINYLISMAKGKTYYSILPRLNILLKASDKISFTTAYSTMSQNINVLSHNRLGLASDLWVPITKDISPSFSKQLSAGTYLKLPASLNASLEIYSKHLDKLIAYKESSTFDNDSVNWTQQVTTGKGRSYGLEILIEKSSGRISGWVSYAWSRSFRKFNELNSGKEFPYKYDRPNDFKISLNWNISKRLDLGAVWVFSNGSNETTGNSRYISALIIPKKAYGEYQSFINDIIEYQYNSFRLPDYHRLDLMFNVHFSNSFFKSTLSLGLYNVYDRRNPYTVQLSARTSNHMGNWWYYYNLDYISLFGILPFINYSFNF
jgi:hypothetical protein